jgi:hypothetical protein
MDWPPKIAKAAKMGRRSGSGDGKDQNFEQEDAERAENADSKSGV